MLGPLTDKIFPNYNTSNFSIIIRYTSIKTTNDYGSLISIPGGGNNNISLMLDIPGKTGTIGFSMGNTIAETNEPINSHMDLTYIIVVKNSKPILYTYADKVLSTHELINPLLKTKSEFNKILFDYTKSLSINNGLNLTGYLYNVLTYNDSLETVAIKNICGKLYELKSNKFDCGGRPDMNEHFFDTALGRKQSYNGFNQTKQSSGIENFSNNIDSIGINDVDSKSNRLSNDDTNACYNKNDKFKQTFDNKSGGLKHHNANVSNKSGGLKHHNANLSNKCIKKCDEECNTYSDDYRKVCWDSCVNFYPQCGNPSPNGGSHHSGSHHSGRNRRDGNCPIAYRKNGKYIVYIPKRSKYAKELGKHGEFDYGRKRHHAKKIYEYNFPECPIPEVLDDNSHNPTVDSCPFIVKEGNPCYSRSCRDTDWSKNDITKCKMNGKCKNTVNNYCEMYNQIDPACICWDPKYKDDKKCAQFRRYFETNDKCSINQFKITEHPDIGKYVKRDNIPCWNCDLDDAKSVKVKRQYK